jgi:HSP20 family protein
MPGERTDDLRESGRKRRRGRRTYLHRERFTGDASRSFALRNIDEASISAKMEDGVLTITLPKIQPEEKRIAIE